MNDSDRLLTRASFEKLMRGEPMTQHEIFRIIGVLRDPGLIPHSLSNDEMIGVQQKLQKFLNEWQQALNQNNPQQQ